MTKEEAIKWVDDRMCCGRGTFTENHPPIIDECWEAGVMAMKALKALSADTVATIQTGQTYGKSADIKELAEVVRCKDCRYAQDDVFHLFCELKSHKVMMEDYCSYGERREHGQD